MKKTLFFKILSAGTVVLAAGAILWACQKEKYPDDGIDAQIAASPEMEAYIIAGYELQAARNEFQKAMNAIDWSQMQWVKDEDGHEVMQLPIQSLIFEERLNQFNDKKNILQRKYRRIVSCSQEQCEQMIRLCLKNSVEVNTKLLNLGINIFQPTTKIMGGPEIFDELQVIDSLQRWINNPNYVEAATLMFADSTNIIIIDSRNGPSNCIYPNLFEANDGRTYYPPSGFSNPVIRIGHTHKFSANPSEKDKMIHYQGVERSIFFNGTFHNY